MQHLAHPFLRAPTARTRCSGEFRLAGRRVSVELLVLHHYVDSRRDHVSPSGDQSATRHATAVAALAVPLLKICCSLLHAETRGKREAITDLANSSDEESSETAPTTGGRHTLRGPGGQFTAARANRSLNTATVSSPTTFAAPSPSTPATQSAVVPPPPPPPPRVQRPYIDDDEMAEEKMFYGDGRAGESPHDFKKKVMQKFMGKGMNDVEKIEALGLGMASGSLADAWFDDPARDAVDKTTWATMSSAFDTKLPKRAALRRVGQDAIEDLLAEKLKVEDIGKRVMHGGVEEFGHVVWARKLARIAANIPDPSGLFIGVVREKMPVIMQDLLGPGTVFANWAAFEAAVVDIKRPAILNAQAKEARLVEMAGAVKPSRHNVTSQFSGQPHPSPVNPPQCFVPQPYPAYPPFRPPPPPAFVPAQPQAQPAPRAYRPDAERLADLLANSPVHHPATDAGRAAYTQLINEWHTRNGNQGPNELRPYPLTPGTAPLDSRGECFNCALLGHMTRECPNPSMPPLEKKWRQIAASIRNGAAGIPRRTAPAPTPIQYVSAPYHFDPNATYPYPYYPSFSPYTPPFYAPEYDAEDQGKGQGPSN
ncbi:hypothetical protein DFH09DRAFT_1186599 [Mycena vulgaris]|nr:hypothetical protein DFH09DRAFT_1186599 [Mycena vulgaris]